MISLASPRVGWAEAAAASVTAGSALGPRAQVEGPGSCGPAVALCGCRAGEVVGLP